MIFWHSAHTTAPNRFFRTLTHNVLYYTDVLPTQCVVTQCIVPTKCKDTTYCADTMYIIVTQCIVPTQCMYKIYWHNVLCQHNVFADTMHCVGKTSVQYTTPCPHNVPTQYTHHSATQIPTPTHSTVPYKYLSDTLLSLRAAFWMWFRRRF